MLIYKEYQKKKNLFMVLSSGSFLDLVLQLEIKKISALTRQR